KLSSENPVKEGFARTAVRFHLNLPQGGFWGRRHWALLPARAPAGGENPQGFHPFANSILAGKSAAGRQSTPLRRLCAPCIATPAGAQCRRKGVLCLPRTMPDWGKMNR
ncbi:MAG: hypothetical protein LBK61_01460, partial [Spirochaetaceae bacterium]|nr:hypothetical protein [Spirochaetaceae bacterium]